MAAVDAQPPVLPHVEDPCLHRFPPLTPQAFYRERRAVLALLGAIFVFLAVAAAVSSSGLLLTWDAPVERFAVSIRSPGLDTFFLSVSRLGSTWTVLVLGAVLAAVAWPRCRAVAIAVIVSTLCRPLLEYTLKEVVSRQRPTLDRLVVGTGPSFPSGHVMASIALWGLVPVVVGLFTRRRWVWWSSVALSGTVIVLVAASRVYLGVHWMSDVVGAALVGSFFLIGVEVAMSIAHRYVGCGREELPPHGPEVLGR